MKRFFSPCILSAQFNVRYILLTLCMLSLATGLAPQASAHPHLFITTIYTLVFDQNGLKGIKVFWEFDEMYSITTVEGFDTNGDGIFNKDEAAELAQTGVESLAEFEYFTHVYIDGQKFPVTAIDDMTVTFSDNHLVYTFFIPCPLDIDSTTTKIHILPFDENYFAAMFFEEQQPLVIENGENYVVSSTVGEDNDTLIFYDMIHPMALHLTVTRK